MMLIEALVATMIIVLGILGIAGLTARSVTWAGQAQYRTEAGMFAAQMVQAISLKVDRSSPATLAASLQALQHQPSGDVQQCRFSGSATSNGELIQLLSAARGEDDNVHGLPGATAAGQQILVNTTGDLNQVTVSLCWQAPHDEALRNYQIQAYVH
jgi:Tfp pilus assembly protein PilV